VIRFPQRASAGLVRRAAGTKRLPTADRIESEAQTSSTTATRAAPIFQPHHQPLNYYARFGGGGTADRARHLKDARRSFADIEKGTLPRGSLLQAGRGRFKPASELHRSGEWRRTPCRRA